MKAMEKILSECKNKQERQWISKLILMALTIRQQRAIMNKKRRKR